MTVAAPPQDFSRERLERLLTARTDTFIRHDVDYDLQCAVEMAIFEAKLGITSTYYIRCRAEEYNPFGRESREKLRMIQVLGHTLGLHVDLGLHRGANVSDAMMEKACENDLGLFVAGGYAMSRRVSFHAPPHDVYGRDFRWFDHALGTDKPVRYVADSRGVFRRNPETALAMADEMGPPVQLNLHPEWWFLPWDEADALRAREALKP